MTRKPTMLSRNQMAQAFVLAANRTAHCFSANNFCKMEKKKDCVVAYYYA